MPSVGTRKNPNTMGNFAKDSMYSFAKSFLDTRNNIMREGQIDYAADPSKTLAFQAGKDQLEQFYIENSVIGEGNITASERQDQIDMMRECFQNDIQAVRENSAIGMSNYNPMIGLSLPMHKYLMMQCMFAQAVPRYVAKAPSWTETMETRWLVTPEGKKIDIANQQNEIYAAWKNANSFVDVAIALPEVNSVDILDKYFHVNRTSHNLSVATHIAAVAVEDWCQDGEPELTIEEVHQEGPETPVIGYTVKEKTVSGGPKKVLTWKPYKAEFTPGYGECTRVLMKPVDFKLSTNGEDEVIFHDTLFANQNENMFEINSASGKIKAVKLRARYDASSRMLKTNRVEWSERSTFVQIPESDGITVPITPEEVKDIGAMYGINQVTKCMSIIKDVLENVKDDDIKENLDESFMRLDDEHRLAHTIDFAPREGYALDHLEWLQKTFMNTLDQAITGLLSVLRDPNMQISVIGRPGLIRQITPVEYAYQTPSNVGAIELDFKKTVVTSDKRVYNFISSEKMNGNDNLIILLNPKNTNRIVYRLYDYQMYISNEIRDNENPALPALTAFQRYKFFEYQPVQARLFCANPSGLREHLPNVDPIGGQYANNDLGSVYTHYDPATGKNVQTENVLP